VYSGLTSKTNRCVGCSNTDGLKRRHEHFRKRNLRRAKSVIDAFKTAAPTQRAENRRPDYLWGKCGGLSDFTKAGRGGRGRDK